MAFDAKKFFDPSRVNPRTEGGDIDTRPKGDDPLTVSGLVNRVKDALKQHLPATIAVIGEISNCTYHGSGHVYFSLKDTRCSIAAAMFKAQAAKLKFRLEDGMEVLVEGNVDVYDMQGKLQLYAKRITPRGAGELELAFRQLKDKLSAEGLFDTDLKKPLPTFPRGIGVVTSATGAAVRDIGRTLKRRWGLSNIYLLPALVQGPGAAEQIARAIATLDANADKLGLDVLIVGRGGGSLEDLWAFNEEPVVRAIAAARTPIISAVGHEVDVTLADFAADVRAATPTAGAELAVPDRADLTRQLNHLASTLTRHTSTELTHAKTRLSALARSSALRDPLSVLRIPAQQLDELANRLRWTISQQMRRRRDRVATITPRLARQHPQQRQLAFTRRVDQLAHRLQWALGTTSKHKGDRLAAIAARLATRHPTHALALAKQQLAALGRQLEATSYRATLQRGFSVTRGENGTIVRSAKSVRSGDRLETELADGKLISLIGGRKVDTRKPTKKKDTPDAAPTLFDGVDD